MAARKIQEGSEEYMMFLDFWNLCKQFWDPEDSEEYWESVAKAFSEFHKKHGTPYSKHFAVAMLNALEEAGRKR